MNLKYSLLIASGVLAGSAVAYTASNPDRRAFVSKSVSTALPFLVVAPRNVRAEDEFVTTESGLQYKILKKGDGAVPLPGQTVKAHYTGTKFF